MFKSAHNKTERECKALQSYRVHFSSSYGCLLSPPPIECPLHLVTVQLWISRVLSTFREWVTNVYFWSGGRFWLQSAADGNIGRVRVTAHKRATVLLNWLGAYVLEFKKISTIHCSQWWNQWKTIPYTANQPLDDFTYFAFGFSNLGNISPNLSEFQWEQRSWLRSTH